MPDGMRDVGIHQSCIKARLLTETTSRSSSCLHSAVLLGAKVAAKGSKDSARRESLAHRLDNSEPKDGLQGSSNRISHLPRLTYGSGTHAK